MRGTVAKRLRKKAVMTWKSMGMKGNFKGYFRAVKRAYLDGRLK